MASYPASAPLPVAPGAASRPKTAATPPQTYAAIDLGTNNCRLLIARPVDGGFTVVDAFSRLVRLGEGLASSGRLTDGAMDRAVEALAVCADKLKLRREGLAAASATTPPAPGAAC